MVKNRTTRHTAAPISISQDAILMLFLTAAFLTIGAALFLAVLYLGSIALPLFEFITVEMTTDLNGFVEGGQGLITIILLLVGAVCFFWLARHKAKRNPALYVEIGCPGCHGQAFKRIKRTRGYDVLRAVGIPIKRYACKQCTWKGARLSNRRMAPRVQHRGKSAPESFETRMANAEEMWILEKISSMPEIKWENLNGHNRKASGKNAAHLESEERARSDKSSTGDAVQETKLPDDHPGPENKAYEDNAIFNPLTLNFEEKTKRGK